jgi:transposase/TusA-related sulfurtransferase
MARYKHTDVENGQRLLIDVNLREQLLPGTFEYMLNDLIGSKIEVSMFDRNYKNDRTGATAIPPAALIKLIIYGYIKGLNSSREIWWLARTNITAKALTGDMAVHFTTIADFIRNNGEKFQEVFAKVLAYCVELGLVGGETLAVDGLRLPSNASIEMSGTEEELGKKLELYRRMAEKHISKHRKRDERGEADKETERHYQERQKYLNRKIEKISGFLEDMEQKEGRQAKEVKSNVTDNESAMIRSSSGFLQGYIGIAVSDKQNQIIIGAEAVGSANEGEHLPVILDKTLSNMKEADVKTPEGKKLTVLMDNNYFSEENFRACQERGIEAISPDGQYRKRLGNKDERRYQSGDFKYQEEGNYYECPNGKRLEYKRQRKAMLKGREWEEYQASATDCRTCPFNTRCIKTKKEISTLRRGRKLMIAKGSQGENLCNEMRKKLDTEEYQDKYACRIQIIEPVFANISNCKGLDRFTLRGNDKVNGQWKLYCIVHNLSKCLKGYNEGKRYA